MRTVLSNMMTEIAISNPDFVVLTGDHGYALFDEIRRVKPESFYNVGMIEQAMVGIAAGLSKTGHLPMVYGLSCFIPMRVLEQIKMDICYPKLNVKIVGDGAGLVYSTLGSSHQCGEDIACLRVLPHMEIYSPGDPEEMRICFKEFIKSSSPSYLRVGKCDNHVINKSSLLSTAPYFTHKNKDKNICLISTGAMLGIANNLALKHNLSHLSVMKINPLDKEIIPLLRDFKKLIFFEEHKRAGGLTSSITDFFIDYNVSLPEIKYFSLENKFSKYCGSHQYALSEHGISDIMLSEKILQLIN